MSTNLCAAQWIVLVVSDHFPSDLQGLQMMTHAEISKYMKRLHVLTILNCCDKFRSQRVLVELE